MTSIVVPCDGCGAQLDAETRFGDEARRRARHLGWSVPPTNDWRRDSPDYCPACVEAGLVSDRPGPVPLILEHVQSVPGKTTTFVKTEDGWSVGPK